MGMNMKKQNFGTYTQFIWVKIGPNGRGALVKTVKKLGNPLNAGNVLTSLDAVS
jgi:hypothetical protein